MAVNWRKGYETWLDDSGDNDYVYAEFLDEIQTHLLPYVSRLIDSDILSQNDSKALVLFYFEQIEYLKEKSDVLHRERQRTLSSGGTTEQEEL
jgi:hypothetical protein